MRSCDIVMEEYDTYRRDRLDSSKDQDVVVLQLIKALRVGLVELAEKHGYELSDDFLISEVVSTIAEFSPDYVFLRDICEILDILDKWMTDGKGHANTLIDITLQVDVEELIRKLGGNPFRNYGPMITTMQSF